MGVTTEPPHPPALEILSAVNLPAFKNKPKILILHTCQEEEDNKTGNDKKAANSSTQCKYSNTVLQRYNGTA